MPEITFADLGNKHRECHCVINNHKSKTSEAPIPENCFNSKYAYESERANPISEIVTCVRRRYYKSDDFLIQF